MTKKNLIALLTILNANVIMCIRYGMVLAVFVIMFFDTVLVGLYQAEKEEQKRKGGDK